MAVGLLDPVSAQTGIRVSEEILMILGNLAAVPLARASTSAAGTLVLTVTGRCRVRISYLVTQESDPASCPERCMT